MKAFALNLALLVGLICLSRPASSQEVTMADLQGAVISVSATYQEKIIRDGRPMSVELHTSGQVTVSSGTIHSQFQSTSINQTTGRSHTGASNSSTATLDKPAQGGQGNDFVWTFADGSLVRLRVFSGGAGGQKMTISFRRSGDGLSCSFSSPMAREVGVGRIHKGSAIDNVPIDILQFRQ